MVKILYCGVINVYTQLLISVHDRLHGSLQLERSFLTGEHGRLGTIICASAAETWSMHSRQDVCDCASSGHISILHVKQTYMGGKFWASNGTHAIRWEPTSIAPMYLRPDSPDDPLRSLHRTLLIESLRRDYIRLV